MPSARLTISITDLPPFRRLVEFVEQVDAHANAEDDFALRSLVDGCWDDLLAMVST